MQIDSPTFPFGWTFSTAASTNKLNAPTLKYHMSITLRLFSPYQTLHNIYPNIYTHFSQTSLFVFQGKYKETLWLKQTLGLNIVQTFRENTFTHKVPHNKCKIRDVYFVYPLSCILACRQEYSVCLCMADTRLACVTLL